MKDYIKEGDIVKVDVYNATVVIVYEAFVRRIPQATGDSWVFEDVDNGDIYYVSEGITVFKRAKQ